MLQKLLFFCDSSEIVLLFDEELLCSRGRMVYMETTRLYDLHYSHVSTQFQSVCSLLCYTCAKPSNQTDTALLIVQLSFAISKDYMPFVYPGAPFGLETSVTECLYLGVYRFRTDNVC